MKTTMKTIMNVVMKTTMKSRTKWMICVKSAFLKGFQLVFIWKLRKLLVFIQKPLVCIKIGGFHMEIADFQKLSKISTFIHITKNDRHIHAPHAHIFSTYWNMLKHKNIHMYTYMHNMYICIHKDATYTYMHNIHIYAPPNTYIHHQKLIHSWLAFP